MTKEVISTEGPQCPDCHLLITADEPHYYDEDAYTEEYCVDCDKTFAVSVGITTTWICSEIEENEQ